MKGLRSEQWNIMWPSKEWNSAICTNVGGPIMYYANWNKSEKCCISLICGQYKQYRIYKQNKQIHRKRKQTSCYKRQSERNRDKLGVQGKQITNSIEFSSVAESCPTLCDPMDCSTPGFPVHHQLPEFIQIHIHTVGDVIQPSHPLLSPSPAFNLSQHHGLFKWVSSSDQVAKVLEFQFQH